MKNLEKRKLEIGLNQIAKTAGELGVLRKLSPDIAAVVTDHDLDAEMVFCGPPTAEYLKHIGWHPSRRN